MITILCENYPGLNPFVIAEMTLYQVQYFLDKLGERSEQQRVTAGADTILGKNPGQVPSSADLKALAKQINPALEIPNG